MKRVDKSLGLAWLLFGIFSAVLLLAFLSPVINSPVLHFLFSPLCHQNPERCFAVNGFPMAICIRCVAIYAGIALGSALYLKFSYVLKWSLLLLAVAVMLNLSDYWLELIGFYENVIAIRFSVGFLLGLSIANVALAHSKRLRVSQPA